MKDDEELTLLLGEIQTANTKAQTALTMAEAIRKTLSSHSADFEAEYIHQLEALLSTIPPSLKARESLNNLRSAQGK